MVRGGRARRRLDVVELAEAALATDLALALLVAGFFLPAGTVLILTAMVPFAVLAARHRLRVVAVAGVVAVVLATVVLGPSGPTSMALDVGCGAAAGWGLRRRWGLTRTVALAAPAVWLPVAGATVGFLVLFDTSRHLAFAQLRSVAGGVSRMLDGAAWPRQAVETLLQHWAVAIGVAELLGVVWLVGTAWLLALPLVRRLDRELRDPLLADVPAGGGTAEPPGPVPVRLAQVTHRYPGAAAPALTGLTVDIPAAAFVAVVGSNGSGKSTLGLLLAGLPPTAGIVERPGPAGLGRPGGTALIGQRPDSQVLGVLVRDDVVWGLARPELVDVEAALATVGLAGLGDRETATLSGGQLQRLAVAAALTRRPALLISDESTSMLDPDGQRAVMDLLHRLPAQGITVVHVTHRAGELQGVGRVLRLAAGQAATVGGEP